MFVTVLSETFYLHPAFFSPFIFAILVIFFFIFYVLHYVIYIAVSSTNISPEKEV